MLAPATETTTFTNLPLSSMHAPVLGPSRPGAGPGGAGGLSAAAVARGGVAQTAALSDFAFDDAHDTFGARGYAVAPGGRVVGNVGAWAAAGASRRWTVK